MEEHVTNFDWIGQQGLVVEVLKRVSRIRSWHLESVPRFSSLPYIDSVPHKSCRWTTPSRRASFSTTTRDVILRCSMRFNAVMAKVDAGTVTGVWVMHS